MATERRDGRSTGPELTEDPFVIVTERGTHPDGVEFIVYELHAGIDNERWRIDGTCNQCGQCEWNTDTGWPIYITVLDPTNAIGDPMTVADVRWNERRDVPVRPSIKDDCPACSLSGQYLP